MTFANIVKLVQFLDCFIHRIQLFLDLCIVHYRMKKYQIANMKNKDQRMKAMNEVLEGIKVGQKERQC